MSYPRQNLLKLVEHEWPPATEQEIQAAEAKLGVRFPDEYREFLAKVNGISAGGYHLQTPAYNTLGQPGGDPGTVTALFTLSPQADPECRLTECQHGYHFDLRVPKRFIRIGCSMGYDSVCISTDGPDLGAVYEWYPPGFPPDYEDKNTEEWLRFVAPSFSEFWANLTISEF